MNEKQNAEQSQEAQAAGSELKGSVRPRNFEQFLILEAYNLGRSVAKGRIRREVLALIEWWGRQEPGRPSGLPAYKIEKLLKCLEAA